MLFKHLSARQAADIAIEAGQSEEQRNRAFHVFCEMTTLSKAHRALVADTLEQVIKNPGDITAFVALYWADGKRILSKQLKLGLTRVLNKFSAIEFAEHRDRHPAVKLRDVIALVHPKPKNREQGFIFAKLCNKTFLPTETKSSKFPAARVYRTLGSRKRPA